MAFLTFSLNCGYCGHKFEPNLVGVVHAPRRDFGRVKCPACSSIFALDVKVRKIRKATSVKKKEKAAKEKAEKKIRKAYEATADCLVKPWSSLTEQERRNWGYKMQYSAR